MNNDDIAEKILNLTENKMVYSSHILPFESVFIKELDEGKVILLGAKNEYGNRRAEGFSRGWYLNSMLDRVSTSLGEKLSVVKIPFESKDFIFITKQSNQFRLSEITDSLNQ